MIESITNASQEEEEDTPAGLLCGCKKVNELVPRVRLARFHNESLPSLLGLPSGGEAFEVAASSVGEGCCDMSNCPI